MVVLLLAALMNVPEPPPPPAPTDHDAKCVVYDVLGKSHPVEVRLTFVGRSEEGNPKHRWTVSGDPNLFPSGSPEEMTAAEEPRYTFSEIRISPIAFPAPSADDNAAVAYDEPLPRSTAKAFGEKAFLLTYRLDFDMEPEVYMVRHKDQGFLRVYVVNEDMSLEARSIGLCDITSHPSAAK
jgi:hypothetical protein